MARWVVIGGTGYIGGALCRHLVSDGRQVLSVSRASANPAATEHLSLELSEKSDFSRIFQPGDRVIYAAGLGNRSLCQRSPQLARWLNTDCPVALLRAADSAGIESFVYLSSVKALNPPQGVVADEQSGMPAADVYGRSKWEGEQQLLAQDNQCRLNLVRPASVYGQAEDGADSKGRASRWRTIFRALGYLPLLPVSGRRSFIALQDLVHGIILLAEAGHCDRQTYILAEPRFYDLAAIASAVSGAPVCASGRLAGFVAALRPLRRLPFVCTLLELERSELYSAARFRRALPWRAQARYSEFLRGDL